MTDPGLLDSAADVALHGPEHRGGGKYRYEALANGGLQYSATVLGLQWLALNRARLAEIVRSGER